MKYTNFNINEIGEYEQKNSKYYLKDEFKYNNNSDNIYIIYDNIDKNDIIELLINSKNLKNNQQPGFFKLTLERNSDNIFEIINSGYSYPSNMPYSKDAFICNTELIGDKYRVIIKFNRYFITRSVNEFNIYSQITHSQNPIPENFFENSDSENITTWKKIQLTNLFILDMQNNIIQKLIQNRTNIENETVTTSTENNNVVDLMIFMGQSNMLGLGNISSDLEDQILAIKNENNQSINKEFKLYEDNSEKIVSKRLIDLSEPFGTYQNYKEDGTQSQSTGSLVTALTNAYYKETGIPVVAISSTVGGKSVYSWWNRETGNDLGLQDAEEKYISAVNYLEENGYTIRNKYMIWCQGESDSGTQSILPKVTENYYNLHLKDGQSYSDKLNQIINTMENIKINKNDTLISFGIDKAFLIRIGNRSGSYDIYNDIQEIQTKMCLSQNNLVLASTAYKPIALCKEKVWNDENNRFEYNYLMRNDLLHYHQLGYNLVGYDAGKNIAYYSNTGEEPEITDYIINRSNNSIEEITYNKKDPIHIDSITLNKNNISMIKGNTDLIVASIQPSNTTDDKTITWSSSNNNVVTVTNSGVIIAKEIGNATITATTSNNKTATCNVTVTNNLCNIYVSKEPKKTIYTEGEDFDSLGMEITAQYENNSTKKITEYSILDGNNLQLNKNNITISYTENNITKTTTQKITVNKKEQPYNPSNNIINNTTNTINNKTNNNTINNTANTINNKINNNTINNTTSITNNTQISNEITKKTTDITNNQDSESLANSKIVKAGSTKYTLILLILIFIIVSYIFYIKYKNIE